MSWKPTEEQVRDVAIAAEYIHKKFEARDRTITVHIGKED